MSMPTIVSRTYNPTQGKTYSDGVRLLRPYAPTKNRGAKMGTPRPLTARELAVMDRIEKMLRDRGSNWSQLARSVGKTTGSASQWSGRRSFPREQTLYAIAQQLGVGMGWLLSGDEPQERRLAQTATEQALLDALREMSPDEQRALLAAAQGIKGSLSKK